MRPLLQVMCRYPGHVGVFLDQVTSFVIGTIVRVPVARISVL